MSTSKKSLKVRDLGTERRLLPVKLTQEELLELGQRLAEAHENIDTEEKNQISVKQEMKARLTELQAQASRLSSVLRRKEEHREVNVMRTLDYGEQVYREVRADTAEVIKTRPLTDEERQLELGEELS